MNHFLIIMAIIILVLAVSMMNSRKIGYYVFRKIKKGDMTNMVNMINELIGKEVKIRDIVLGVSYSGKVIEVEEKWLKIESAKKKGSITRIIALDSIGAIEF